MGINVARNAKQKARGETGKNPSKSKKKPSASGQTPTRKEQKVKAEQTRLQKKTNLGVGIGLLLQFIGVAMSSAFENGPASDAALPMILAGVFVFAWESPTT